MKERGILLPIFSLPSKYGIGDFGYEAYEFIDILSENHIEYWNILPIFYCEDLPYSPLSYYAIDDDYISLDKLIEYGLIDEAEQRPSSDKVIYDNFKQKYFKIAFERFVPSEGYNEFIKQEEIQEFADFMASEREEPKEYFLFLQYIAYKEWMEIKEYANSKGVRIIGDMPVYPPFRSVDTKYHPENFEMVDGKFTWEAGTPPDYYNAEGQKWNSPVYNVEYMKEHNFDYLIRRYKYNLKLFDRLRIDYFRGYDSFFRIPYGRPGSEGEYHDGVSYAFFDELFKDGSIRVDELIIEDLGDIREETKALRRHYGFTRQKILQFALDLDNYYDMDNYSENVVILPGNHDCSTVYGWYKSLDDKRKEELKEFLRRNECYDINVNIGVMQYIRKCKANIAIIQVQDILGLDDSARINRPGTSADENWTWKLVDFEALRREIKYFN